MEETKMELSKRLETISRYVPEGAKVADIGTDHAYLPIYLIKSGIADQVLAMDVNKGPLEKAEQNIKKYLVGDKIKTRLSNGLAKLGDKEADTVIVAGMGGMLVASILQAGQNQLKGVNRLILQPQSDYEEVRKTLHALGWKIIDEDMLNENNKYYFIMVCDKGEQRFDHRYEYCYGQYLAKKDLPVFKTYMTGLKEKKKSVLEDLARLDQTKVGERVQALKEEINMIEEALKG